MHRDGSVHPPGRAMPLVVSSASPCLQLGDDAAGKCGFVQVPPGQSWLRKDPCRVGLRGFCITCILASRQRFWRGLRDTAAALKEGAASLLRCLEILCRDLGVPWDCGLGGELCQLGCIPSMGLGHC